MNNNIASIKIVINLILLLMQKEHEFLNLLNNRLKLNRTIYGFHFEGNYGYVDSFGFLVVSPNDTKNVADSTIKQRIDGVRKKKVRNKCKLEQVYEDNCWICN